MQRKKRGATGAEFSRRQFLTGSLGLAGLWGLGAAARNTDQTQGIPESNTILLKGGYLISMDENIGDYQQADILIEGDTIAEVGGQIESRGEVVDATDMIIMPGFVDTHRHMWQGGIRNILPGGTLGDYLETITGKLRPVFRPEDARIGNVISALGAINAGVTTVLDWSHIGNTPEHTDAAIEGLRESGIRGVYAFGGGSGQKSRFPEDIGRLREEHFSSEDQLLHLAMAAGIDEHQWKLARDVDAPISVHVNGTGDLLPLNDQLGEDVTCIHCTNLLDEEWQLLADTGAGVSISAPVEMQMGHGIPPIMKAREYGIKPSLSVDVETSVPGEFFTQMRCLFALQRMQAHQRQEHAAPDLMSVHEVLEYATMQGARDNGLASVVGSLTPGKKADLIMLRKDRINVLPVNDARGAVIQGMDTSNVDTVIINGEFKKWKGELAGVELERLAALAARSRDAILERAEQ